MFQNTVQIVRITQILVDNGWIFIDNGYNRIESVIHEPTGEKVSFSNEGEFEKWLYQQAENHSIQ